MASRTHKPKPISINPNASHKPEDEPEDGNAEPVQQTLEEARAEENNRAFALPAAAQEMIDREVESAHPARIKLKWTKPMQDAAINAIYDYRESAGAMPSILDLYEIVKEDEAFAHLTGQLNHKGVSVFSPQSLQTGVNAIRKKIAKDIAAETKLNGTTDLLPLPSLARVQTTRTQRVTDSRALGLLIAQREASLKAAREAQEAQQRQQESGELGES